MQDEHRKADDTGEQRKRMQQTEKTSGIDRALQRVELKWHAEEKIPKRYAEEERGRGSSQHQGTVPRIAPARVSQVITEAKADGPQNESHQ